MWAGQDLNPKCKGTKRQHLLAASAAKAAGKPQASWPTSSTRRQRWWPPTSKSDWHKCQLARTHIASKQRQKPKALPSLLLCSHPNCLCMGFIIFVQKVEAKNQEKVRSTCFKKNIKNVVSKGNRPPAQHRSRYSTQGGTRSKPNEHTFNVGWPRREPQVQKHKEPARACDKRSRSGRQAFSVMTHKHHPSPMMVAAHLARRLT